MAAKLRTLQVTGTGAAVKVDLPDGLTAESIYVKAHKANAAVGHIGDSTVTAATGFELDANQGISVDFLDPEDLYWFAGAGDKLSVLVTSDE